MPKITVQVKAFQINDGILATITDGDELLCSGHWDVKDLGDGIRELDFGEDGKLQATVTSEEHDPEKYGIVEGQRRFYWEGTAEIDDD